MFMRVDPDMYEQIIFPHLAAKCPVTVCHMSFVICAIYLEAQRWSEASRSYFFLFWLVYATIFHVFYWSKRQVRRSIV